MIDTTSLPSTWTHDDQTDRLVRQVTTDDFMAAVDMVNRIAQIAEEQHHHPDLHLTSYNQLRIEVYSHDAGTVTSADVELATKIEAHIAGTDDGDDTTTG